MAFLDDDEEDGLGKTLVAQSRPYGDLGGALLQEATRPRPMPAPGMPSQRDILLAMQNPDLQTPANDLPSVASVHVPTLAPAAVAQTVPITASMPGKVVPSSGDDKAAFSQLIESQRPDLGLEGDVMRGLLWPSFTRDLFDNYWQGGGQGAQLSGPRFKDIADHASKLKPTDASQVTGPNGEALEMRTYNLYESPDYRRSLGTSKLFYDQSGKPVGFYDYYNFDPSTPQHPRDRTWDAEAETRIMNLLGSVHGAKPFPIYYGEYVPK